MGEGIVWVLWIISLVIVLVFLFGKFYFIVWFRLWMVIKLFMLMVLFGCGWIFVIVGLCLLRMFLIIFFRMFLSVIRFIRVLYLLMIRVKWCFLVWKVFNWFVSVVVFGINYGLVNKDLMLILFGDWLFVLRIFRIFLVWRMLIMFFWFFF